MLRLINITSHDNFPTYISKLIHGNVRYKNLLNVSNSSLSKLKVKYPAFRKEAAFSYEKEYRFVIQLSNMMRIKGLNINLGDPALLKFSILVNPLLEDKEYKRCLRAVEASGFKTKWKLSPLTKWVKPKIWEAQMGIKAKKSISA
jgi:hypothetical protein